MNALVLFLCLVVTIFFGNYGFCLQPSEIERLTRAGVGINVIQALIEEKSIETCAFSVEDIIRLKALGLKDTDIEAIVRKGSFLRGEKVVVYGKETVPVNAASLKDIIDLKQNNFSDEIIKAIILISSGISDRKEREEAIELLKRMGIVVDLRSANER